MPPKVTNFKTGEVVQQKDKESIHIEDDDFFQGIKVETPSGATMSLLTQEEADFYNLISRQYQEHNKFNNISDLLELDRVLSLEVLCFRQSTWALLEGDYEGRPLSKDIQKNLQLLSREIRDIKSGLGIDKKTRDVGQGDTIAEKWENLKARAHKFGWMRNEQVIKAHTLWKELEARVTMYKNSTPQERTLFEAHGEDLMLWLEEAFKEFDKIDEAFREEQKMWVRSFQL